MNPVGVQLANNMMACPPYLNDLLELFQPEHQILPESLHLL